MKIATAPRSRGKRTDNANRLGRYATGGRWAVYEAAKAAWDQANAGADYQTRDATIRRLALAKGV